SGISARSTSSPRWPAASPPGGALAESVLHFLAGLLQVAGYLVTLALGLEAVVADGVAGRLLGLALEPLYCILDLVHGTHWRSLHPTPSCPIGIPAQSIRTPIS